MPTGEFKFTSLVVAVAITANIAFELEGNKCAFLIKRKLEKEKTLSQIICSLVALRQDKLLRVSQFMGFNLIEHAV